MMRRHELDPVSLTFGFVFGGLGLLFLLGQADQALRLRWVWPLLLLGLGLGILLDVTRTRRPADPGTDDSEPHLQPTGADPDRVPGADLDPDRVPGADLDPDREPGADLDPDRERTG